MTREETNHSHGVESQSRIVKSETLRDKVVATLPGFILTGVVGTMLATWFQERGWAWQNAVEQVEKDTTNAMASLQSASDLLDRRWSATFQMVQAIQNPAAADLSTATANFLSVNHQWELGYADVDVKVQFDVDRPFGIDAKLPKALWELPCTTFPFGGETGGTVEPGSAHIILNVINYCHGGVKDIVSKVDKASLDQTSRKKLIDEAYIRLSHIYYINDAFRCVVFERAVAMRRSFDSKLGWGSLFWIGPQQYSLPAKEGDCFSRYRDWYDEQRKK